MCNRIDKVVEIDHSYVKGTIDFIALVRNFVLDCKENLPLLPLLPLPSKMLCCFPSVSIFDGKVMN